MNHLIVPPVDENTWKAMTNELEYYRTMYTKQPQCTACVMGDSYSFSLDIKQARSRLENIQSSSYPCDNEPSTMFKIY